MKDYARRLSDLEKLLAGKEVFITYFAKEDGEETEAERHARIRELEQRGFTVLVVVFVKDPRQTYGKDAAPASP